MKFIRILLMLTLALGIAACGNSKFRKYNGPEVTQIQVHKADRKMYLIHKTEVLKEYDISLGGPKREEMLERKRKGTHTLIEDWQVEERTQPAAEPEEDEDNVEDLI